MFKDSLADEALRLRAGVEAFVKSPIDDWTGYDGEGRFEDYTPEKNLDLMEAIVVSHVAATIDVGYYPSSFLVDAGTLLGEIRAARPDRR